MIEENVLKKRLKDYGCSSYFIREAIKYYMFYNNNLEEFITYVEEKLKKKEDEFIINDKILFSEIDYIALSEKQYNGDSLTSHGYDYEFESKRY